MFAALHYRDFRLLWYSSVMAGVGRWTMMVGQAWLVFLLTQSALWVGITTFAIMLPYLLGPILGGPMADRFDRRRLLMTTYLIGCGSVAALAVLAITDLVEPWHVIALGFVGGLARSVEFPAIQSLIPNLVPRANLLNGIALQGVANQGTRLIGPAIAVSLLATPNASGTFVVAAVAYLLAMFWASRIHTPSRGQAEPLTRVLHNFREGLGYLYGHSMVALIIILVAFHCSLTMSFESILPLYTDETFRGGGAVFSYLVMAVGGGAVGSTLALAALRNERRRGVWLLITGVFSALTPVLLAVSSNLPLALVAAAGMGASQAAFMTLANSLIQSVVPDALRGRISSLYIMHAGGLMAFANLANGYFADFFGAAMILMLPGLMFLMVLMSVSVLMSGLRRTYRTGILPAT